MCDDPQPPAAETPPAETGSCGTPVGEAAEECPPGPRRLRVTVNEDFARADSRGRLTFHWRAQAMPIRDVVVELQGTGVRATTTNSGCNLDLTSVPDGEHVLSVTAQHTSNAPVGPRIADPLTDVPQRIYRPLEVDLTICCGRLTAAALRAPTWGHSGPINYATIGNRTLRRWRPTHLPLDLKPIWIRDENDAADDHAREYSAIKMILIHCTGGTRIGSAINTFLGARNAINYMIDVDGHAIKMLRDKRRGRHIGDGAIFNGVDISNGLDSIGFELVHQPSRGRSYPAVQFNMCRDIVRRLLAAYRSIHPYNVVGHVDLLRRNATENTRLGDPGRYFNWPALERLGVGMSPAMPRVVSADDYGGFFLRYADQSLQEGDSDRGKVYGGTRRTDVTGTPVQELQQDLAAIGYAMRTHGRYDAHTKIAVESFQAHFFTGHRASLRPHNGRCNEATADLIKAVRVRAEASGSRGTAGAT